MPKRSKKSEWDIWIKEFLSNWINGLMKGIDKLDDKKMKEHLFELTDHSCTQAHIKTTYEKAWKEAKGDLDKFVQKVNSKLENEVLSKIDDNQLQITYDKCLCPLVSLGLTANPILCTCSPNRLTEIFEGIFNKKVEIVIQETILSGAKKCTFIVKF
ncbi:MAG: hypothetical protein ACTSSG_00425 [Candidatus Heimdallarchaeaceae archaeon]